MEGNRATIAARRIVPEPPPVVFAYLSDLRNHWMLADRFVEVLDIDDGKRDGVRGGRVRLRGPLGIHRTVQTDVTSLQPNSRIAGTATLIGGTCAQVSWDLSPIGPRQTDVHLTARVERLRAVDSLLLELGGRRWLRRRFATVLATLGSRL